MVRTFITDQCVGNTDAVGELSGRHYQQWGNWKVLYVDDICFSVDKNNMYGQILPQIVARMFQEMTGCFWGFFIGNK